jgi:hypothetical protein
LEDPHIPEALKPGVVLLEWGKVVRTNFNRTNNYNEYPRFQLIEEMQDALNKHADTVDKGTSAERKSINEIKTLLEKMQLDQKTIVDIAENNQLKLTFLKTPPRKRSRLHTHQELYGEEIQRPLPTNISQDLVDCTPPQPAIASLKQPPPQSAAPSALPPPAPTPHPTSLAHSAPVTSRGNAFATLLQNVTSMSRTQSNKGIYLSKLVLDMRPLRWDNSIASNAWPAYITAPNRAKCMHALYLLNDVATAQQKEILGSKHSDVSDDQAKEAAAAVTHLCMQKLLELERSLQCKDTAKSTAKSKAQPTAIGIGSRYQKCIAEVQRREVERKKARRVVD